VVGTVLIQRPKREANDVNEEGDDQEEHSQETSPNQQRHDDDSEHDGNSASSSSSSQDNRLSLRDELESVTIYCAGFCKIDSRWHNVDDYIKIYGPTHPHVLLLQEKFDAELLTQPKDTVCIWATNGMEALQLPERKAGRWHELSKHDDKDIFSFTFRVDLPHDLPHSLSTNTCRYYYVGNLLIKTKHSQQQQLLKRAFVVTTNPHATPSTSIVGTNSTQHIASTRVKFGSCLGMAHSNGLPCHLSASELARPNGQMTVKTQNRLIQQDVQTIRVRSDQGQPVCLLTVMGLQTLTPGNMLHLEWEFDKQPVVPCYFVAACLKGEERAVIETTSTTKCTQSFLVDTCHEWVEPNVTDTVAKSMLFDHSLCNVSTDIVQIRWWLQIDMTVDAKNGHDYQILTLQLPLHIRHEVMDEDEVLLEQEERVTPLTELLGLPEDPAFPVQDVYQDLKNVARILHGHLRQRNQNDKIQ
jgi:hypothetical protein